MLASFDAIRGPARPTPTEALSPDRAFALREVVARAAEGFARARAAGRPIWDAIVLTAANESQEIGRAHV